MKAVRFHAWTRDLTGEILVLKFGAFHLAFLNEQAVLPDTHAHQHLNLAYSREWADTALFVEKTW